MGGMSKTLECPWKNFATSYSGKFLDVKNDARLGVLRAEKRRKAELRR
jgi:hypothetical protein